MLYELPAGCLHCGVVVLEDLLQEGDGVRQDGQVAVGSVRHALGQHREDGEPHRRPGVSQA